MVHFVSLQVCYQLIRSGYKVTDIQGLVHVPIGSQDQLICVEQVPKSILLATSAEEQLLCSAPSENVSRSTRPEVASSPKRPDQVRRTASTNKDNEGVAKKAEKGSLIPMALANCCRKS